MEKNKVAEEVKRQAQKELINLKLKNDLKRHEMKMKELTFARETEEIRHENALTRMRIKSAEIKKAHDRKVANQYPRKW